MLIFLRHELTFLATPKTGTTAVEMALRPRAEIVFARGRKHITAQRYHARIAPFLEQTFNARPETCAVMRDPVTQIRSWYRYRSTAARRGVAEVSTSHMSFDDFVRAVIAPAPPAAARIGSQFAFLTSHEGIPLVDHLFAHDAQPAFRSFLEERLSGPIELKQRNVSPEIAASLSPSVEAELREARAAEFALYDRLRAAGGYLHIPQRG
ncbi:hypothetical protein ACFSUD_12090 [Sulfitobacter aestuarii]|uniref:Gamma-glutamyl kinase n=1 Tax=Sulfitobacter aestuarii TaxID=2161676 RepID=A0ABW5U4H8_9RHOB